MAPTTVLITGANRGIGKGLVAAYLRKPNITVIAACRDTSPEKTEHLHSLPRGTNCNLITVSLSLDQPSGIIEAVQKLQAQHGISQIDVVVANAGICDHYGPLIEMTDSDLQKHLDINTFGPLRLFRAVLPFLQASQQQPRFVYVSTELASLAELEQNKASLTNAYGMSKVAGNYFMRRAHFEYEDLITLAVDPGFVQTDMGNRGARAKGLEVATLTVEQSVNGIIQVIEQATKSTTSGHFLGHNGEHVPW
ncbi:SDR family oxidoreductase [Aspergillus melleus]|uniref:SDR family oxidoreductase n=1 Tax=Aspergillus melleus TaxID=138277 RepID=UPI001E8E595E|nr:uncharacterized protein LDX57_012910 [Aspergillus melleus]KAH8435279.1 hypothetical protein LDX57_012910 [Aspergillus melleus]